MGGKQVARLIMAASQPPRSVRDVPAEQFIRAYAEHLKANDKVSSRSKGQYANDQLLLIHKSEWLCCSSVMHVEGCRQPPSTSKEAGR